MDGRLIEAPRPRAEGKVVDLMEALRRSAGAAAPGGRAKASSGSKSASSSSTAPATGKAGTLKGRKAAPATPRRKAG